MVGVVGSSPIAPTKQNPLCWAVWKGSPKGEPFFVVWRLCLTTSLCLTERYSILFKPTMLRASLARSLQAMVWLALFHRTFLIPRSSALSMASETSRMLNVVPAHSPWCSKAAFQASRSLMLDRSMMMACLQPPTTKWISYRSFMTRVYLPCSVAKYYHL